MKGWAYFVSLGLFYAGTMVMFFILCMIAAFNRSPRYHSVFALFFLIYNLGLLSSSLLRLM